jgi:hypothetical protein
MNTEAKWGVITIMILFGVPMAGLALDDFHKNQCKIVAIQAGMQAEEIIKVCNKK